MGWANVSLKDINPENTLVGEGAYTFALRGAKLGKYDRIECNAIITSQGEFFGQPLRFSYPDPEDPRTAWSLKSLKRLEVAMGVEQEEDEDILQFLTRAASEGAEFEADVFHEKFTDKDTGEERTASKLKISSVRAAT